MKQYVLGASSLGLMLLAACAAPNPKPSVEPAPWRPPAETKAKPADDAVPAAKDFLAPPKDSAPDAHAADPIVARVAGKPIYVSELLSRWFYRDTLRVRDDLMDIATGRLVLAEAARLRVEIATETSSKAYEQAIAAMENEFKNSSVARKYPKMTLDSYLDRQLGLDPSRYRERVHDEALRGLLADRVVRAWILQQEHAEIRVIVVGSEDDLEAARQDLKDGKSFEDVARARSTDPSKEQGGVIAPIVRLSTPLSKAAFDTPVGAVSDPITDAGAWLLLRVDARPTPLEGDWVRVGRQVEESLTKRPVDEIEAKQWHEAMTTRYEVQLSPFFDLVGESKR